MSGNVPHDPPPGKVELLPRRAVELHVLHEGIKIHGRVEEKGPLVQVVKFPEVSRPGKKLSENEFPQHRVFLVQAPVHA